MLKPAIRLTLRYDCLNNRASHTLNCCKTVTNIRTIYREFTYSRINVRWKNVNSHLATGINIFRNLSCIVNHRGHKSRHKFYRIIVFQIRGLIRDNCISRCMRFIKCIFCKVKHFVINLICHCLRNAICNTTRYSFLRIAIDKVLSFLCHHICFFLRHRTAKQVASSQSISSQITHNLHNLFLIYNTAVGCL